MWKLNYGTGITVLLSIVALLDKGICQSQQTDQLNSGQQTQRSRWADLWRGSVGGAGGSSGTPNGAEVWRGSGSSASGGGSPTWAEVWSGQGNGGGGTPNWMQMADQFMSSWRNAAARREAANNGTAQPGGFLASLMDGIASFSTDMAARAQNSTTSVSPRFQRVQNRTRDWFSNWRTNMNNLFV